MVNPVIRKTGNLVLYTGPRADISRKVGELRFAMFDKSGIVKWVFKPLEGTDRKEIFVFMKNISFLDKEEIERMELRLSSTNIRSNHKKRKVEDERLGRQYEDSE